MAARKTANGRKGARPRQRAGRLESTWRETRRALSSAEKTVGKRVAALVERCGLQAQEAVRQAEVWRHRLDREGKKARKQVETRLADLRVRAKRESRTLSRNVDEAVSRALAALNIPSRHEVQELVRKVDQLTRRIEGRRR
jgi:poly(hydroxyalkanoate) granule-associated protein